MLIMSQNRESLFDIENGQVYRIDYNRPYYKIYYYSDGVERVLGEYKDNVKAKKALKEMAKCYAETYPVYYMPEEKE